MAFAELRKPSSHPADQGLSSGVLYQRLETLLVSGGDARLTLARPSQHNAYGCTPFPRPDLLDFASSTGSNISQAGYARADKARARLLFDAAANGLEQAFERCIENLRAELRGCLGIAGTEIVFSPSGTDAQLQALFLAGALARAPLMAIVAGSDQTGRGTKHTARGRHFSACTSQNIPVEEGASLDGFGEDLRTVEIPFCDVDGAPHSEAEMDALVLQAVESAIAGGAKVLLQALDSSKLGWRAPSDACLNTIATRWPDDVRIIIDACQMRLGTARLRAYLDRGYAVLMTGSKFFTGPAFSGALLIPPSLASAIDGISDVPPGLCDYSNRFDWPRRWSALRDAFPAAPNYGQWLRWEAALEEMSAYFDVPATFRDAVLGEFADLIPRRISQSSALTLLPDRGADEKNGEMRHRTIFAFTAHRDGRALDLEECRALYRALGRDLSAVAPVQDRAIAGRICQIGQPVDLHPAPALRLCTSARLVTSCWQSDAIESEIANVAAVIEKLEWLIAHPEYAS